jgi:hypothetical protein
MTLINSRQDMKWLKEVHLPRLSRRFKSAILHGNEDCPNKVEVYRSDKPSISSKKVVYVRRGSSCRLKRKR